jgi:hypothetical protein
MVTGSGPLLDSERVLSSAAAACELTEPGGEIWDLFCIFVEPLKPTAHPSFHALEALQPFGT